MTENKELFNIIKEKDLQLHIEFGDDGRYNTKGISIVTFKRELGSHLHLKNVIYVSGLKKILISIVVLEEKGYDVVFNRGKSFLKHVVTGQVKHIEVRVKNLDKLEVDFAMHATIPPGVRWGDVEP